MNDRIHAWARAANKAMLYVLFLAMLLAVPSPTQQPLPEGCLQSWEQSLAQFRVHCDELKPVEPKAAFGEALAEALSAETDEQMATMIHYLNEKLRYGPGSEDATINDRTIASCPINWVSCGGYSIGYYQLFRNGHLWDCEHIPYANLKFIDYELNQKVSPDKTPQCKNLPAHIEMAPQDSTVYEANQSLSVIGVWRYIRCEHNPAPFKPFGAWCRLVFLRERPDCASLSREKRDQVKRADAETVISK